ncbi:YceI family protein [Streptomyces sulfonofaciens]|nr:YceI family protein [Streptomyces sulfonofaciens]
MHLTSQILPAGAYRFDLHRSSVSFTTRHMFGMGEVVGTLSLEGGDLFVADSPEQSRVTAQAAAATFDTGSRQRDKQVKSRKFLDAAAYPTLGFVSDSITAENQQWIVRGLLTVRGEPVPVAFAITHVQVGEADARIKAEARIDRYAHGVTKMKGMAARHLDVVVDAWLQRS